MCFLRLGSFRGSALLFSVSLSLPRPGSATVLLASTPLSFPRIPLARAEEDRRRGLVRTTPATERNLEGKRTDGRRRMERKVKLEQRTRRRRGGFPPSRQEMYVGTVNPVGCNGAEHGRRDVVGRGGRKMDVPDPQIPRPRAHNPPPVFLIFTSRSSRTLETQGAAAIMPGCTTIPAGLLSLSLSFSHFFLLTLSSTNLSLNKALRSETLF